MKSVYRRLGSGKRNSLEIQTGNLPFGRLAYLEPVTPTSRLVTINKQDFQRAYSFNGNCS